MSFIVFIINQTIPWIVPCLVVCLPEATLRSNSPLGQMNSVWNNVWSSGVPVFAILSSYVPSCVYLLCRSVDH